MRWTEHPAELSVVQLARRLLSSANHDVVHVEHLGLTVYGYMQTGIVDAVIGHARTHRNPSLRAFSEVR
jgi:hypothetical protein